MPAVCVKTSRPTIGALAETSFPLKVVTICEMATRRDFVHCRAFLGVVVDGGDDFRESRVACSFAHSIHARMHPPRARADSGEAVGARERIVVVRVEFESEFGPGRGHQSDVTGDVVWRQHAQGVRQIDACHSEFAQVLRHGEDVVEAVAHPARPVFEVDIDGETLADGVPDGCRDRGTVLLRRLSQLCSAVALPSPW